MRRLAPGDALLVATSNPGKRAEIERFLADFDLTLLDRAAFDLPSPEETGATFEANAAIKARAAARAVGGAALGDDSGFCVQALDGRPGPAALDWAGPDGDFAAAGRRVLAEAAAAGAAGGRAWYETAVVVAWPDGVCACAAGRAWGRLAGSPRGVGFGYDPIFIPEGEDRTMAEIEAGSAAVMGARRRFSHRRAALQALAAQGVLPAR